MDIYTEGQNIEQVEIQKEIKTSYIDYAMSVIVGRALPDVRDGLKPVHRRVLYSMYEDGLTYDKAFRKSATTVGNVLGSYHPHGDVAVYDTLVRMAQPFSLRYPLVEGHGNFGNIDGDGAAAYRYTEARMAKISNEMLADLDKNVVDFMPNFDNRKKEPVVLPSRFPNLLVNGSVGIAVGMATNIPPHNLGEVIDATVYLMDNPDCTIMDLMQYIKGPDFPTGATIYGKNGIYEAYTTGRGKIRLRAKYHFEEHGGRQSIVYTEIPYQVNKSMLVKSIADLVNDKKIEGIADLRDESGRDGMRIVVDLKKDVNRDVIVNLLYKNTQLQDTFAVNMLALVNNEPKTLNLKQVLTYYVKHQEDVITRRTIFDRDKALARLHILEGYKIAIDNIDEVVRIIRSSKTVADAKSALIERFGLSDVQGQAIVEMPLGKLAGLEIEKVLAEMAEKKALVEKLNGILADINKVNEIIRDDLLEIKRKFGDERLTGIEEADDILLEDLIEKHKCIVTMTNTGYIKRMRVDLYQAQNRGGKGITAMATRDEDYVKDVFVSHSHNYLFMFSNFGKLFVKKCYEIPEASRTAKGMNIVNILNLAEGEKITTIVSGDRLDADDYLTMVTRSGTVKRTPISCFRRIRKGGLRAIGLAEGDELIFVARTDGNNDILIGAAGGRGVRFHESDVRVMGRTARGVRGIRLAEGDRVVGCVAIDPSSEGKTVLTITENGYGKRTEIDKFPVRHRGGKGVIIHKLTDKTGVLAGMSAVREDDDIIMISDSGLLVRTRVDGIPCKGRATMGVRTMRVAEDAKLISFQRVKNDEELEKEEETASETTLELDESTAELEDIPEDAAEEEAIDDIDEFDDEEDTDEEDDDMDEDDETEE